MICKHETFQDYSIISLEGQYIGDEEIDKLSAFIREFIQNGTKKIILNFENVTYISSVVIGLLIKINAELANSGGKLAICNVNKAIMEVFKIIKIDLVLHIFQSLKDSEEYISDF